MSKNDNELIKLSNYRHTDYSIDCVDLNIELHAHHADVTAHLKIIRDSDDDTPLILDGDELNLIALQMNGIPLAHDRYSASPQSLTIMPPDSDHFTLDIVTRLEPAANMKLMGLYQSHGTYCTQCEAEGFRRITYFLDRPDILSTYTTRIEGDKKTAPILLGNGNLIENGDLQDGRHYAIWHDPHPKACYLFAMVAGDLGVYSDYFLTQSGRKITLNIYVEHGKESRTQYAMDALKRSMAWDETAFGREYDLEVFNIVAVSDFNMGAMENKGLNIFNDKFVLVDAETATDLDYTNVETVIAHEYFHNWTGNRVTCRDWFQLCLKEGLTVFRDQEFSADMRSRSVKRIADVRRLRAHQFPEDSGPLAHPVRPSHYREISNFYTATIYEKGAEICRMLQTIIGKEAFRRGMDLFFERHDGQAVTVEDFIAALEASSKQDLSAFMRWYNQSGTPHVAISSIYDEKTKSFTLDISQTLTSQGGQISGQPVPIPIKLGLISTNGEDIPLQTDGNTTICNDVLLIEKTQQSITFKGIQKRPVPSLFREFSAPIKLISNLSLDDTYLLLKHDHDNFNRWEAAHGLAKSILLQAYTELCRGKEPNFPSRFADALIDIISNHDLEAAFRAQILNLPSENDIAQAIAKDVDPTAIAKARAGLRSALAQRGKKQLIALHKDLLAQGHHNDPNADAAGQRALSLVTLDLACADGDLHCLNDAFELFQNAANMTERMGALTTLVYMNAPQKKEALDVFYHQFTDNPLVIDKWFMVQAMAPDDQTLETVQALTHHPAYSMRNPNRVRSLIGAFSTGNLLQFNQPSGKGYTLVADAVLTIDKDNPQVAARLLASFRSWRSLEARRRTQAENTLIRVAKTQGLSRDVFDIIDRSLNA